MATGTTYNDREFLFRLQTLIIDGGTDVLRNIFDRKLQKVPLNVFLANEKTSIKRLRAQTIITKAQYDLLFPPGGQPPNSAHFDITLIICLLRNLKPLGLNPNYKWNTPPSPADVSVEADLCRLKGFRNEIAHISSTFGFTKTRFESKWIDIEQVLLRLDKAVLFSVPGLKQTLDSYKRSPLDPAAENRFKAVFCQWREMEKGLVEEMKLIKSDVTDLRQDMNDVVKNVKELLEMDNGVKEVTRRVEVLSRDVKDVKKKVQRNIMEVKDDVAEVKGNIQKVKKDFRTVELLTNQKETRESDKIEDLQHDLIFFYRNQHRTISLSPLIGNTPLLEFYVMPDIYSLKQRTRSGVKQEKTSVTTLRNVFYNDNKMCRNIYLTADAGLGKTALSKRIALTWCHAKKTLTNEGQYFLQEEIQAINEFRVVFLLLLRNCSSECEIDDLILNQIISQLPRPYSREFLENILFKERCLVILDGLDEWRHPSNSCKQGWSPIPHRRVREQTAVLTTCRPWKLSVIGLQSSEIDQKLEILGLNQESANLLKRSVVSHFFEEINEWTLENHVAEFTRAVAEKQISDLEAIPLLLMYLLFLWCNKIELGQSQCDLYSQITELLLSRTVQNYYEISPKAGILHGDIPQCLSGKNQCTQFYTLLTALGQLAYQTLFRETREENTLVFDVSVAEQYINKDCMNFCLKTGLITQTKDPVPKTPLGSKSKVSFAHKTMQEFFAALYMHSTSNQNSVLEIVLSNCKCIKDILEMSKTLQFGCGMNVKVSSLISREMMKIINEDENTHEYRSSLESYTPWFRFSHPLKDFQDMCIACCKEIPLEKEASLCLQDVFIERSCEQEQYREHLIQLTTRNKQNIRSLYIDIDVMRDTPYSSVQKVIEYIALSNLEHIEKIHYEYEYNSSDIIPLMNRSVKCLYLSCSKLQGSWSHLLSEKVTSLQKLEAINIHGFEMSHSELTLLYDFISQRHCMRQIELEVLRCTDHWLLCTGYILDLSQPSQLNKLTLRKIPVSELKINMASLEKCRLEDLSNPDLVLRFIHSVQADNKLNTFVCGGLKSPVAIETMLETLRLSVHVKHVKLDEINLSNREVLTSKMVNIERVKLWGVTMTALVLQGIVDILQQQSQTVTVDIRRCDVEPESEFVTVKQKIKTWRDHFRVLKDSKDMFNFEAIKWGD